MGFDNKTYSRDINRRKIKINQKIKERDRLRMMTILVSLFIISILILFVLSFVLL